MLKNADFWDATWIKSEFVSSCHKKEVIPILQAKKHEKEEKELSGVNLSKEVIRVNLSKDDVDKATLSKMNTFGLFMG